MGGPGSTGSSMLRIVLNRHPEIFSGAELNFFNKEQVFEDWQRVKHRLLPRRFQFPRLTTKGWTSYAGTLLLDEDYGWSRPELERLISDSASLETFVEKFFARPLKQHGAAFWIEKTPSNAYSFRHFLDRFDDARVIHTARDPLDTVASLVRRGLPPILAAGVWVYNSATAMRVEDSGRYLLVRYEDFVSAPEACLEKLMDFLERPFHPSLLRGGGAEQGAGLQSWENDPAGKISTSSIGGFQRLDANTQEQIVTALSVFSISDRHVRSRGLCYRNCQEICEKLDYDFRPKVYPGHRARMRRQMTKNRLYRTLRCQPTGWWNYPARMDAKGPRKNKLTIWHI